MPDVAMTMQANISVIETLALQEDKNSDPPVTHADATFQNLLRNQAHATEPVDEVWSDSLQLVAGAATLDLAGLVRAVLTNVNLTGKKLQGFYLRTPANTAFVTVGPGATNPYNITGEAASSLRLPPNSFWMAWLPEGLADVAGGAKEIDFASTDADAIVEIVFVAA